MTVTDEQRLLFNIKRNDLKPYLQVQVFNPDGTPRDVTADTIVFHMKKGGTLKVTSGAVTKVLAASGIIEYRWAAGSTDTAGTFRGEFELNDNETYPKDGYITIEITEDLN